MHGGGRITFYFYMRSTLINFYIVSVIILCFAVLALFMRHAQTRTPSKDHKKLFVVCTTSMITDTAKQIGGQYAQVKGLMGPGVDPHTYRARESDVHTLAGADIIFYNGLHLEGKIAEILHGMRTYTTTVALADAIPKENLLKAPDCDNLYDPHIWFDVQLWISVTNYIRDTLIEKDPEHAQDYIKNTAEYIAQLNTLHKELLAYANKLPKEQRIVVTAHDAFGYFGKAYSFQVIGLQGINTDAQAGTRDIKQLVDVIVSKKIPAVFVESSVPQRTIQAVQQATHARGWPVKIGPELYSDALGLPDSNGATYIDMIRYNMHAIVDTLANKC